MLPGKLQTDNAERRYSVYRQFSGGNYNVSVTQILEAAKKLRIKSIQGLKSAKYGIIPFINPMLLKTRTEIVNFKNEIVPNLRIFRRILKTSYLECRCV